MIVFSRNSRLPFLMGVEAFKRLPSFRGLFLMHFWGNPGFGSNSGAAQMAWPGFEVFLVPSKFHGLFPKYFWCIPVFLDWSSEQVFDRLD